LRTASSHWLFDGAMRKALGYLATSISVSTTQGWMFGIFARAMIGVVASASPELNGPQMQFTLSWLIISWVAFTALVGSPWVSRMTISILRPLTPPAALMASTAKATPRLKPWVGAEAGPVIAARLPILIVSDWAMAGAGKENLAAPNAPALPNNTSRREIAIIMLPFVSFRRPSLARGRPLRFGLRLRPDLSGAPS
jgi:hypothetical protein